MSRGLGRFQREIVAAIRSQGTTTLESLRWDFAVANGATGDLPKSDAFACERAVRNLAKRNLLMIEKRPLATIDEWLAHYPGKTHRRDVRQLRLDLLPVLIEWVRSDEGPGPLYSADQNERFFARGEGGSLSDRLSLDLQGRGLEFAPRWQGLEPALREHLVRTGSDDVFYLIARGKYLFTNAPVETRFAFGQLVDKCTSENLLPDALLAELNALRVAFIPPEVVGVLALKSVVYRFITSVVHRHPDLKPDAIKALYRARPDYMPNVPGCGPAAQRKSRTGLWFEDSAWRACVAPKSPLTRLIDQTTFQKFHFLSSPAEGVQTTPPKGEPRPL